MKLKILIALSLLLTSSVVKSEILYPWPRDTEIKLKNSGKNGGSKGSLQVTNSGNALWLVQTWAEDEQYRRYNVIYPSIYRLEPFSSYALNIYPENKTMAGKLKWFLVTFIPSTVKNNDNRLVIPVTYRLKIINDDAM